MALRLGEILIKEGRITQEQLTKALEDQKRGGGRLGYHLVKLNFISEEDITKVLSRQFGIPAISLATYKIDAEVLKIIPADVAKKYMVLPVHRVGPTLTLAMTDPSNVFAIDDIKFMSGLNVEPVVATEMSIIESIKKYYGGSGGGIEQVKDKATIDATEFTMEDIEENPFEEMEEGPVVDVDDFDSLVSDAATDVDVIEEEEEKLSGDVEAPIVKLVNGILIKAIKLGCSDIHIECYEKAFRVRYRLDGVLRTAMNLPMKIKNAVISRIKIMSRLDIAERRLPQDGRIKLKLGRKKDMDFRVSVLPCLFGEKVVMRLLDKSNLQLDMTKLGFEDKALADFQAAIHRPFGMVLVTGPTGSGKTTTLYSALHQLNQVSENIMTAEDPVEFNLTGINQVQMHDEIGLNFAAALRSFLRQDPDIIMVGEIRDYETAEIGVKAALTGHMVLSTLHTNDAPSTINRLLNMGIEPFLVASSVVLIGAQRLARKVCSNCKEEIKINPQALIEVGFSPEEAETMKTYKGRGCVTCSNTGYKGRIALYEVMPISERLKELILQGAPATEIKNAAIEEGMMSLRMSGLEKIKIGMTTPEEVLRVTVGD